MKAENKMSEGREEMKLQEGFTLLELLTSVAIISIVVAVAVPQFSKTKTRAYDINTQSTLRSVFKACKDFWTFNSSHNPCLLTTISNNENGFVPSAAIKDKIDSDAAVEVTIDSDENNTEDDFYATARHSSSSNIFAIDHRGVVSRVTVEGEDGNDDESNDSKDDGKNGPGCSEEAHTDPHNLGGNAAGGCGTSDANNDKNNDGNNSETSSGNNGGKEKWWEKWGKQWWK